MTRISECAHCGGESEPRTSGDYGKSFKCPACGENVCPSCRAMSGPSICGSFADGSENKKEIVSTESNAARQARYLAKRSARKSDPNFAGL